MIRKILDLSTAHLTQATAEALWDGEHFATTAIESGDDPAFVLLNVPPIMDGEDRLDRWPSDLKAAGLFARANDCDFLKFDRDADEIDGLPTYDWDDIELNGLPLGSTLDLAPAEAMLDGDGA